MPDDPPEASAEARRKDLIDFMRNLKPRFDRDDFARTGRDQKREAVTLRATDQPIGSVTRQDSNKFPELPNPETNVTQVTGGERDPFELIETTDEDGNLAVNFEFGRFGNPIPTLDGTALDDDPDPHTITAAGSYQAWLQVNISCEADNFHPSIDDSEILVEFADVDPAREDFIIEWEDEDDKTSGAFFVLIAAFEVEASGDGFTISSVDQSLRQNYRSIVQVASADDDYVMTIG